MDTARADPEKETERESLLINTPGHVSNTIVKELSSKRQGFNKVTVSAVQRRSHLIMLSEGFNSTRSVLQNYFCYSDSVIIHLNILKCFIAFFLYLHIKNIIFIFL